MRNDGLALAPLAGRDSGFRGGIDPDLEEGSCGRGNALREPGGLVWGAGYDALGSGMPLGSLCGGMPPGYPSLRIGGGGGGGGPPLFKP